MHQQRDAAEQPAQCRELDTHVTRGAAQLVVSVRLPAGIQVADVAVEAEEAAEQHRLRVRVPGYEDVLVCDVGVCFGEATAKRQRKTGMLVITCPLQREGQS